MTNKPITVVAGISAILSVSAGAMNLLTNPSFEAGSGGVTFSASTEFGGADAFALTSVSSEIPGWSWEQNGGGGAEWLQETGGDIFGTDGSHLLFLDPNQSIQWTDPVTVVAGEDLQLGYNFASWTRGQDNTPASGSDSTILLEYNYRDLGDVLHFGSFTGPSELVAPDNGSSGPGALTWLIGSFTFEIPADYGSEFNFQITNTGGLLLDDLSIVAVPEPGSVILIGLGLMVLASRRSHRR